MARQVWTHIFARHFTEPDSPPGTESVHPRYFFSRRYEWIDGQHFFGYIDFAEGKVAAAGGDRAKGFEAATRHGIRLEDAQMVIRGIWKLLRGPPPGGTDAERLLQVRPPNTPLFEGPGMAANAVTYNLQQLIDMTAAEVAKRPELAAVFSGNPMWGALSTARQVAAREVLARQRKVGVELRGHPVQPARRAVLVSSR
jgi:hypothetical protein